MQTCQYFSGLDALNGEQYIYMQGHDAPRVTITRTEGANACAMTGNRAFHILTGGKILLPRFSLYEGRHPLWRLSVRSPLRNVHRLESESCGPWKLKTPFFNIRVSGTSANGASLQGWMAHSRTEWLFSFSGIEPPDELLVAVAVLHRLSYFQT